MLYVFFISVYQALSSKLFINETIKIDNNKSISNSKLIRKFYDYAFNAMDKYNKRYISTASSSSKLDGQTDDRKDNPEGSSMKIQKPLTKIFTQNELININTRLNKLYKLYTSSSSSSSS